MNDTTKTPTPALSIKEKAILKRVIDLDNKTPEQLEIVKLSKTADNNADNMANLKALLKNHDNLLPPKDNSPLSLTDKETSYLNEVVEKYNSYKTKTDKQQLLINLSSLKDKTEKDIKTIKTLLSIQKGIDDLAQKNKSIDDMLKADKKAERAKFEHGTFELGGFFRAMLKSGNADFINAFKSGIASGKIKKTYTDNTPLFAEYDKLEITPPQSQPQATQSTQPPQGNNTPTQPQNPQQR